VKDENLISKSGTNPNIEIQMTETGFRVPPSHKATEGEQARNDSGRWKVDRGRWAVDGGRWKVDRVRWTEDELPWLKVLPIWPTIVA